MIAVHFKVKWSDGDDIAVMNVTIAQARANTAGDERYLRKLFSQQGVNNFAVSSRLTCRCRGNRTAQAPVSTSTSRHVDVFHRIMEPHAHARAVDLTGVCSCTVLHSRCRTQAHHRIMPEQSLSPKRKQCRTTHTQLLSPILLLGLAK